MRSVVIFVERDMKYACGTTFLECHSEGKCNIRGSLFLVMQILFKYNVVLARDNGDPEGVTEFSSIIENLFL